MCHFLLQSFLLFPELTKFRVLGYQEASRHLFVLNASRIAAIVVIFAVTISSIAAFAVAICAAVIRSDVVCSAVVCPDVICSDVVSANRTRIICCPSEVESFWRPKNL
jgi:hypothetical protein